jgi:hypothetical protein
MDTVTFQEEEVIAPLKNKHNKKKTKESYFVNLVIKTKIAKDEKEANPILITIAIAFFITSGIIMYWEFYPPVSISHINSLKAVTARIEAEQSRPAQTGK